MNHGNKQTKSRNMELKLCCFVGVSSKEDEFGGEAMVVFLKKGAGGSSLGQAVLKDDFQACSSAVTCQNRKR